MIDRTVNMMLLFIVLVLGVLIILGVFTGHFDDKETISPVKERHQINTYSSLSAHDTGLTASGLTLFGIPTPSKQKLFCNYFVDQEQALKAYNAGHTYLDGDHDGEICESIRFRSYEKQQEIEHYYLTYLD